MASLGLLGAIGGLGQAVGQIGSDVIKRREQALENARQMAAEQRKAADRKSEITLTHELDMEEIGARDAGATARTTAQIAAADRRAREGREATATLQEDRQTFSAKQQAERIAAATRLTNLRAKLSASNTADAIRLRDKLAADDVVGVKAGKQVGKTKYARAMLVHEDGTFSDSGEDILFGSLKEDDPDAEEEY